MIYLDTLELPDLNWSDPFDTQAFSVTTRRRLNGALTMFMRALSGGRAITLVASDSQPLTLGQALQLTEMASDPSRAFTLNLPLRDLSFNVRFRWEDGNPLELQLLFDYADPIADDPVIGSIRLVTF